MADELKLCIDCKHHLSRKISDYHNDLKHLCLKNVESRTSSVDGDVYYKWSTVLDCEDERSTKRILFKSLYCGPEAKWFERKVNGQEKE